MESVETVMIVGSGGREQALARKLASEVWEVIVSPGNPGNESFAVSTGVEPTDIAGQLKAAKKHKADLTIVGGEAPLVAGIVDEFQAADRTIFGPTKEQARVESDRKFAKRVSERLGVPIGDYRDFTKKDKAEALEYAASNRDWPLYVKDNAPAGGHGAKRCQNLHDFQHAISKLKSYVVETTVPGSEASHHAFCDGKTCLSFPGLVRDHKTVGNNDTGDMTGGMGTIGPLPMYSPEDAIALGEEFALPVVQALGFKGMLFSGLKGSKGQERNLEWNARFGDPEAQVFMKLMQSDLLPLLMACVEGDLANTPPPKLFTGHYAASLVLAAPGYPNKPRKNMLIEGIDIAAETDGVHILQGATERKQDKLYTTGGRVLNVVTIARSLKAARSQAYEAAKAITFDGQPPLMRTDIGLKATLGV